jgi:hypothetical protein
MMPLSIDETFLIPYTDAGEEKGQQKKTTKTGKRDATTTNKSLRESDCTESRKCPVATGGAKFERAQIPYRKRNDALGHRGCTLQARRKTRPEGPSTVQKQGKPDERV